MNENGYATREAMFAKPPTRRYADVEVGLGRFRLQSLNSREKCAYDAAALNKAGQFNRAAALSSHARLIAACCVDGEGNRIFSDEDVPRIQEWDAGMVAELFDACDAHVDGRDVKNSRQTANDDSP